MKRGEIWWAELGEPSGSEHGYRRPVLIVSANALNLSDLRTVLTVPLTSSLSREHFETNLRLSQRATGLKTASVAILSLVAATNKRVLVDRIGRVPDNLMSQIDDGLRLVLAL